MNERLSASEAIQVVRTARGPAAIQTIKVGMQSFIHMYIQVAAGEGTFQAIFC